MSGYYDGITGDLLMCGSPDTLGCLDTEFARLLGSLPGQRTGRHDRLNLESVERMIKARGDNEDLRKRVILAAKLVTAARRLLTGVNGNSTSIDDTREYLALIECALPARERARSEYWWREVDVWGHDGSTGPGSDGKL